MSHVALDLFAGAGGWDVAVGELGHAAIGVEIMAEARETRQRNDLFTAQEGDVWAMDAFEHLGFDTLLASPPCQAYSTAGSGAGRRALDEVLAVCADEALVSDMEALRRESMRWGDERIGLVLSPLTYVHHHFPPFLAFEQVPNVLPVWEAMAVQLRALGYDVWTGLVAAERYGVPQTRKRAVLIGSSEGFVGEPQATHSRYYPRSPEKLDDGVEKWVSMAEALERGHRAGVRSNYGTSGDPEARGERTMDQPAATVTSKVGRNRWIFNDQSGTAYDPEWPAKRPSTTVAGRGLVQNPGHTASRFDDSTKSRNDGVRVTVEEAACLQSFPPGFDFAGGLNKQYLQVGNSVPPLMAKAVLQEMWGE